MFSRHDGMPSEQQSEEDESSGSDCECSVSLSLLARFFLTFCKQTEGTPPPSGVLNQAQPVDIPEVTPVSAGLLYILSNLTVTQETTLHTVRRLWDVVYTEPSGLEGLRLSPEKFTEDIFRAASQGPRHNVLRIEAESVDAMAAQLLNRILQCGQTDDYSVLLARERRFTM